MHLAHPLTWAMYPTCLFEVIFMLQHQHLLPVIDN